MEMTPIGNFIKTKNLGPLTKTLVYLDDKDIKTLSFVMSSTKKEMDMNYEEFRKMKIMGKKIETEKFDPKHLSFNKFIQEINLFVDSIPTPLNLSENQKKYIVDHHKESISSRENDLFNNISFGIESGEKFDKSVLSAIFIRSKYSMIQIIEMFLQNYSDPSFVMNMLPMKAIAIVIDSDEHYIKLLELYKKFGMKIIRNIIEYFDIERFFKKFMTSTLCYSRYVSRHLDLLEEETYLADSEYLTEILDEGNDLKKLCVSMVEEYPEMDELQVSYTNDFGQEKYLCGFDGVFRWIERAISDVECIIDLIIVNK
jgi:hypothetical protein